MPVKLEGEVVDIAPGKLKGQKIARMEAGDVNVVFDVIEGLVEFRQGEKLALEITEERPSNLDDYDFCGHGYIVEREEEAGKTIFSIWGILFVFSRPLGLEDGKKYYLCIKKL